MESRRREIGKEKRFSDRALDDPSLAAHFKLDQEAVRLKLAEAHRKLLVVHGQRIRPGTDDKILVMWNALMLSAFAEAGRALGRKEYIETAARNPRFLLDNLYVENRLHRSWRRGQAKHNASSKIMRP